MKGWEGIKHRLGFVSFSLVLHTFRFWWVFNSCTPITAPKGSQVSPSSKETGGRVSLDRCLRTKRQERANQARSIWRGFKCTAGATQDLRQSRVGTSPFGLEPNAGTAVAQPRVRAGRAPHAERPGGGGRRSWENDPQRPHAPPPPPLAAAPAQVERSRPRRGEGQPRALRGLHRPSSGGSHPLAAAAGGGLRGTVRAPPRPA